MTKLLNFNMFIFFKFAKSFFLLRKNFIAAFWGTLRSWVISYTRDSFNEILEESRAKNIRAPHDITALLLFQKI